MAGNAALLTATGFMHEKYDAREAGGEVGRGLHSSTFQLNVSTFYGMRWVHDFPPVY